MKRKPTFSPTIGSIMSHGVREEYRNGDLITTFSRELRSLLNRCRVDREMRKAHVALLDRIKIETDRDWLEPAKREKITLDALTIALTHYAPPYTTFGEREGEWGFWPRIAYDGREDTDIPFLCAEDNPMDFTGMDVCLATHGNISCGRFDKRGRFHSYWSAV